MVGAETAEAKPNVPTQSSDKAAALTGHADKGKAVYAEACTFCHGADGTGGHGGKTLKGLMDTSAITTIVDNGRNEMPGFADLLSEQQMADVAAYVVEVLNGSSAAAGK